MITSRVSGLDERMLGVPLHVLVPLMLEPPAATAAVAGAADDKNQSNDQERSSHYSDDQACDKQDIAGYDKHGTATDRRRLTRISDIAKYERTKQGFVTSTCSVSIL